MPENWTAVAADITAALADVGFDVKIERPIPPGLVWESSISVVPETGNVKVVDSGITFQRDPKTGERVLMRSLMAGVGEFAPTIGDTVTLNDKPHVVLVVSSIAPGGTVVGYTIRVSV